MAADVGKASGQDWMDVRGHRPRSLWFSPVNFQLFCCSLALRSEESSWQNSMGTDRTVRNG